MSNIVLARLGENIKASVAGNILVSSGPTTAPTLNALVGSIALFAGTAAPTGWLKCDGSVLNRSGSTGYPDLWAFANSSNNIVDETTWNAGRIGSFSTGNGSTTFRIPDLRGEFVRALADGKAVDTGRVIGTAQAHGIAQHQHKYLDRTPESSNSAAPYQGSSYGAQGFAAGGPSFRHNYVLDTLVENPTPAWATDTRPRNIALLYCIKF